MSNRYTVYKVNKPDGTFIIAGRYNSECSKRYALKRFKSGEVITEVCKVPTVIEATNEVKKLAIEGHKKRARLIKTQIGKVMRMKARFL